MVDMKKVAIEIAEKFKFEPYEGLATAISSGKVESDLSRCGNHLDNDFMKSLENLDFLDSKYLSK